MSFVLGSRTDNVSDEDNKFNQTDTWRTTRLTAMALSAKADNSLALLFLEMKNIALKWMRNMKSYQQH